MLSSGASRGTKGISEDDRKKRRSETEDLCAGMMYWVLSARRSHIRTVSSPDPVATWYLCQTMSAGSRQEVAKTTNPFGAKSMARISLTCPSRTIAVRPVRRSHTRPIASNPLNEE